VKVLLLNQYYPPEEQNFYVHECATGLALRGHEVTVLTAFPNYGKGRVYDGYRHKAFQRDTIDGIPVCRSWVYATGRKSFVSRALNFGSFCLSALVSGPFVVSRPDVIYTSTPPLPLGVTAALLARYHGSRLIIHVQDVYPRLAVEHGMLTNRAAIRFFEAMERWIYKQAEKVVVISEDFREDLVNKGVAIDKVAVVQNWADPNFVTPRPKENEFRRSLQADGRFVLIYSGGLNNNANLDPVIRAAHVLRAEPFLFVIVGEGQYKRALEQLTARLSLTNVTFMPFQPRNRYPDVLSAADMNLVTLSSRSAVCSVPSKVYKLMAAARSILAITQERNELHRLVTTANCGICVLPDDPPAVVQALRWAATHPNEVSAQGKNARTYLEQHHTVDHSLDQLSQVIGFAARSPVPV
jgi:colanic acid biosynthesis glycosyl transferase WcaI